VQRKVQQKSQQTTRVALAKSLGVGAIGGVLFQFVGLPLAWMLGPLVANMVMSARGMEAAIPERLREAFLGVLGLVLGSAIGSRFSGISRVTLGRYLGMAAVATLLALVVLAGFAELIHQCMGVPRDVALLALAPEGIGEMAILAVALGLDPVFVAFHHLLRMMALMLFAPL
jgi:hypothetical protein